MFGTVTGKIRVDPSFAMPWLLLSQNAWRVTRKARRKGKGSEREDGSRKRERRKAEGARGEGEGEKEARERGKPCASLSA